MRLSCYSLVVRTLRDLNDIKNAALLEILSQVDPRGGSAPFSPEEKRAMYRAAAVRAGRPPAIGSVSDEVITSSAGPLRLRIYQPESEEGADLPAVLYLHGGAFVSGDLETHDPVCRSVAHQAQALVVAVEYRLAPEFRYPAALDDCMTAWQWLVEKVDAGRLVVAGDSAGGNLAAVLAFKTRDEGLRTPDGQVLIYPALDATLASPTVVSNGLVPPFTLLDAVYMWQQYLPAGTDRAAPYVSPLYANEVSGLPPTLLVSAEFDVLCGEGMAYAGRLQRAGVPVEVAHFSEMTHGFLQWGGMVEAAGVATERIGKFIRGL